MLAALAFDALRNRPKVSIVGHFKPSLPMRFVEAFEGHWQMSYVSDVATRSRTLRIAVNITLVFCLALPFVWFFSNLCAAGIKALGH
jgi:hypothetical protein